MELVVAAVDGLRIELATAFHALVNHGPVSCGISGGGAALIFLPALRDSQADWSRVSLFWTDERGEGPADPGSNFEVARRMLLDPLYPEQPRVFPMGAGQPALAEAATEYDQELERALDGGPLDLAILGVGDDGHLAALVPGHPGLTDDQSRVVAVEDFPRAPKRRLSLSLPYLTMSRQIWIIAVGPRKRQLVQAAMSKLGMGSPFDLLLSRAPHVTIFTDQMVSR
jgi:6-phosphogluconolactonase